jgi:putative inorganic carbon (HCO3(-)) transporter
MQSVILSFFQHLALSFWTLFQKSGTYKLFLKIYNAVAASFNSSFLVNWFKQDADTDAISSGSVLYRILHSPFTFFAFLQRTVGRHLQKMIQQSVILGLCRTALHNMLALNTRFFGVLLLGTSLGYCAAKFVLSSSYNIIAILCGIIGLILCVFNWNITSFLSSSGIKVLFEKLTGLELSFDFFSKKETTGKTRLILAALCGLATGVLMTKMLLFAAVPFAIGAVFTVLYAPITGVFFAVFAAPFVPTMALAGLCALTLVSLFVKSLTTPDFRWKFDGMGLALLLLLAIFLISVFTSFAPKSSLGVLLIYFIFMTFYFVIINTVETKKQLYGLLKVFVIAGAFVALYGVMQYLFGWNTNNAWIDENMFEEATMRVYSTLENPNVLGEYLLLVLPVCAVFFWNYKKNELPKWIYGIIFVLLAGCLILTQSRGCWLGFILAVAVFVSFANGKLWGLLPIAIAILPFVIPDTMVARFSSIGNMEDSSTSYRVFIWFGTLAMLKDFWIGGIGMGEAAFNSVYPFYSYNAIVAPHSHNLYLQLVVGSGVAALAVFIALAVIFIKKMIVTRQYHKKNSLPSLMALAFISGLLGFLLQSMFDYTFYNYRVMAMFFMFLAFGMALKYVEKKAGESNASYR